jgi:MoaA/NifB/PqqE/SkfB family radical SAM enzyme
MIQYKNISRVHLEISTKCNSVCPSCPRNYRGVPVIDHYPLCEMTLEQFQQIFSPDFLGQLKEFLINGNYGDFITCRDGLEIVKYIRQHNPNLEITISTNASAQPNIWEDLAKTGARVQFRIDGMQDTHHLYRQRTSWDLIISNAKKFISAGGYAIWAMIAFSHNRHQIDECRNLSIDLGFQDFWLVDNPMGDRNSFPVFTPDKRLSHVVGDYRESTDWETYYGWYKDACDHPEAALEYVTEKVVDCLSLRNREIYVSANGDVSPCCWTGFYPKTNHTIYENLQLAKIIKNNNALVHGLEKSIEWFDDVKHSWSLPTVERGKLLCCNDKCGINEPT